MLINTKQSKIRELREDRFISSNYKFKGELLTEKFEMKDNDENNSNLLLLETPKKLEAAIKPEIKTSPCQAKITMNTYLNLLKNQIFEKVEKPKEIKNVKLLGRKRIKINFDKNSKTNFSSKTTKQQLASKQAEDIKNTKFHSNYIQSCLNFDDENKVKDNNFDYYLTENKRKNLTDKNIKNEKFIFYKNEFSVCKNLNVLLNESQTEMYSANVKKGYHKIISEQQLNEITKCNFDDFSVEKTFNNCKNFKTDNTPNLINYNSLTYNSNKDLNRINFSNELQFKKNDFSNNLNLGNSEKLLLKANENTNNYSHLDNNCLENKKIANNNFNNHNNFNNFELKNFSFADSKLHEIVNNKKTKSLIHFKQQKHNYSQNKLNAQINLETEIPLFNKSFNFTNHKSKGLFDRTRHLFKKGFNFKFSELINTDNFAFYKSELESHNAMLRKKISQVPYKILDAPGLEDDFYQNLIEWSPQNLLAIGINDKIYLWDLIKNSNTFTLNLNELEFRKANIANLLNLPHLIDSHYNYSESQNNSVSAVSWLSQGNDLAIGLKSGSILIYDINAGKIKNAFFKHKKRIGMFSEFPLNFNIFSAGAHDCKISHLDLRMKTPIKLIKFHKEEICGLKWSNDGKLLASGGNDNKLVLWNCLDEKPLQAFTAHNSAVRAIAWSHRKCGILASGGGAFDKKIKIWDAKTLKLKSEAETNSQICNIFYSKNSNHLVTSHGFKDNVIYVWDENQMEIVTGLKGHKQRVIYMTQSPDGNCFASGAGDETIRFWKIFDDDYFDNEKNKNFYFNNEFIENDQSLNLLAKKNLEGEDEYIKDDIGKRKKASLEDKSNLLLKLDNIR